MVMTDLSITIYLLYLTGKKKDHYRAREKECKNVTSTNL